MARPTVVSLFSGCGGSSLGYRAAGFEVRLAVDNDPAAAIAYRRNFPETPFWESDVAGLAASDALVLASLAPGELDILDGSPPCQGFSMAGKRQYADSRNGLFHEYARLLGAFRPKALVMENVSGMLRGKMRLVFAEVTRALKGAGYRVSCRLLNAWWYGVPQDRRRLFWVGVREDLGIEPSHPLPTAYRPITVAEALRRPFGALRRPFGALRNAQWQNGWRPDSLPAPTLEAARPVMVAERHAERVLEAWEVSAPGESLHRARRFVGSFQSVRLDPSKPSPTQIAAHRNWRWDEPRYLTVGEGKVLQGFPPWFDVAEWKLVGNSVPPPVAEAVGRHVGGLLGFEMAG